MLHYPKIPAAKGCPSGHCLAFEKYDGTNLHWEWDRDFGWHAFGTRRDEFNLTPVGVADFAAKHAHLHEAQGVFQETLADGIERVLRENTAYRDYGGVKAFTEFFGPNSFAGLHKADDPKQLVLFDIWAEGYGFLSPWQFVADFGHLPIARVICEGRVSRFAADVRAGKYGVAEGVVCKGGTGGVDLWMVKVKTHAYMEKLKQAFADKWEDFWE